MFASSPASEPGRVRDADSAVAMMAQADRALAAVVLWLADQVDGDDGLPAELIVGLRGRRPGVEARAMVAAAEFVRAMPITRGLLARGVLSVAQIRALDTVIGSVPRAVCAELDELIGRRAPELSDAHPDALTDEVAIARDRLSPERIRAREAVADRTRRLTVRFDLFGRGQLFAEGPSAEVATIANRVESDAARPHPLVPRSAQRFDALVDLAIGTPQGRSRPRVQLIMQIDDPAATLLTPAAGARVRLSRIATQELTCDADWQAIVFDGPTPVGVSDPVAAVPTKVRAAVLARDQGCRFPGCRAPAAWSDIHHITARSIGGTHHPDTLAALCRRCHRRVHRQGWRITRQDDGTLVFRHRGHRYRSPPPLLSAAAA